MQQASRSDLIEIEVWVRRQTDSAILVSLPALDARPVWVPLSQVEVTKLGREIMDPHAATLAYVAELVLPEWLALDRGLI